MKHGRKTNSQNLSDSFTGKLTPLDCKLMIPLVLFCALLAFINLGSADAPRTVYTAEPGASVTVDFGGNREILYTEFLVGPAVHYAEFSLSFSEDGETYGDAYVIQTSAPFTWQFETDMPPVTARRVRLDALTGSLALYELAFWDGRGAVPVEAVSAGGENLFDESGLVPEWELPADSAYFDEVYYVQAAYELNNGLAVHELTHPPLGKALMAAGMRLFGVNPFGWRFFAALLGVLMVPLLYLFAKRVFKSPWWALFAALLFSFDFMRFTQTRIATVDTYAVFFILGMYYFMYLYCERNWPRSGRETAPKKDGGRRGAGSASAVEPWGKTLPPLAASGLCMGLAAASKWTGLYAAVGLAAVFFLSLYMRRRPGGLEENSLFRRGTAITLACCAVFFVAVPLTVYALSYLPFLGAPGQDGIAAILQNQIDMFEFHALDSTAETHVSSSSWWEWPFMRKALIYFSGEAGFGRAAVISLFGNPAVWYCGIAALIYCAASCVRRFDNTLFFLLAGFMSQYLPWILVPRYTMIYHYFPCLPFLVLLIAYFFKNYVCVKRGGRKYAVGFAAAAAALFAVFYPVISGADISAEHADALMSFVELLR